MLAHWLFRGLFSGFLNTANVPCAYCTYSVLLLLLFAVVTCFLGQIPFRSRLVRAQHAGDGGVCGISFRLCNPHPQTEVIRRVCHSCATYTDESQSQHICLARRPACSRVPKGVRAHPCPPFHALTCDLCYSYMPRHTLMCCFCTTSLLLRDFCPTVTTTQLGWVASSVLQS